MQPFAMKSGGRLKLHWWITAGVAVAFFVWSFDLVPRIRSAATGAVARSGTSPESAELDDALDADWADISDRSGELQTLDGGLTSDDPLIRFLLHEPAAEGSKPSSVETLDDDLYG